MKECLNYKKIDSQTVECFACSHKCKIKNDKVGICGIRKNERGKLYLLAYGKAIATHVDPIEKKPLFHFFPGSLSYSFGTIGCNFRCDNCQNYDISQMFGAKGEVDRYGRLDWGREISPEKIVSEAKETGCQSIAYTYNEPTVFFEYALDTMKAAHQAGLKNVWVSNGFMTPETLDLAVPYLDAINIDIKSLDDSFYRSRCGAKLNPVLENCRRLSRENVLLEVTTLIIPTLSDDKKMLENIAAFIKEDLGVDVPWHISAFSRAISWKLKEIPDTNPEVIKSTYQMAKEKGLKHVYAGNVWGTEMENSYCSQCGQVTVERTGYQIRRNDKEGSCRECGTKIEAIFE